MSLLCVVGFQLVASKLAIRFLSVLALREVSGGIVVRLVGSVQVERSRS